MKMNTIRRRPLVRLRLSYCLVLGIVVVPVCLHFGFRLWAPDSQIGHLQEAFATVAAQTIAIMTAVIACAYAIINRHSPAQIALLSALLIVVTYLGLSIMTSAAHDLVLNLDASY